MKLGQIIKRLQQLNPNAVVGFDFCGIGPTTLNSSRGFYDQLAIGHADGVTIVVSELLVRLRECVGKTYQGYKGGDFIMDLETEVWVDNWGEWTNTRIVGVIDDDEDWVRIETRRA